MASSLAVDESSDIRGHSSLNVTEEFLAIRPVHGTTTGQDLYEEVSRCGNEMELPREKLVGWTTDGAPARFLCETAFLWDIPSHLNAMKLQLQGRGGVPSDMYSTVKAFRTKRTLWEAQMHKGNLSHFPSCQTLKEKLSTSVFPSAQFAD
ncbi:hypothetical protein D4764_0165910 [Takifugu flavidus]|uniref:Uncharacterized protein n=1 Tax=Takifugu flavidus TaxID=433684 RepID=A0A5C6MGX1_9TELE|nr:hypothetical protein D4764_0165910 [Takifugu flavidus]